VISSAASPDSQPACPPTWEFEMLSLPLDGRLSSMTCSFAAIFPLRCATFESVELGKDVTKLDCAPTAFAAPTSTKLV